MRLSLSPAVFLTMTVATPLVASAWLLRGHDQRQLEGLNINMGSAGNIYVGSGGVAVNTPWVNVNFGGGPAPDSLGSITCDDLITWDTDDEPTCVKALPAFINATASFGQEDKPKDRKKAMDAFCNVACGDVWTSSVLAEVLQCTAPSTDEDAADTPDLPDVADGTNDNDDDDDDTVVVVDTPAGPTTVSGGSAGGVNVNAPGATVSTDPSTGTVSVVAPGATVTSSSQGGVQVEAPATSINTANGPVEQEQEQEQTATTKTKKPTKSSPAKQTVTTTKAAQPTYPSDYPGLRLGCIQDPKGQYCAVKRAAISGGDAQSCDFYLSCCYAQYGAMFGGIPASFADQVEAACPGSKDYLAGDLCTV